MSETETLDDDEHVKEVYAHFGLAMYLAQVLEHAIVNALIELDLIPKTLAHWRNEGPGTKDEWHRAFDDYIERHFKQTLGNLLRALTRTTKVPHYIEGALTYTKERRDFLAHHFFRERAETFTTTAGREAMLAELKKDQKLFMDLEHIVSTLAKDAAQK